MSDDEDNNIIICTISLRVWPYKPIRTRFFLSKSAPLSQWAEFLASLKSPQPKE